MKFSRLIFREAESICLLNAGRKQSNPGVAHNFRGVVTPLIVAVGKISVFGNLEIMDNYRY